jgi:hypothetical protein
MTTVADDDGTQDWVADYNGERQEQAARDGRDSRVAMIAAAVEDDIGGQQQQWQMSTMADNNGGKR